MLPSRQSSLPSPPVSGFVMICCLLPPHTCTSTTCFQFPAPAISVLSVCIHPCVFPILSRLVVLLYMGLMLATTARVSHHLYDFAMLSYDDVPHTCLCACTLSNFVHSERKKAIRKWTKQDSTPGMLYVDTLWYDRRKRE